MRDWLASVTVTRVGLSELEQEACACIIVGGIHTRKRGTFYYYFPSHNATRQVGSVIWGFGILSRGS